ncbi:MAG: hypothetical protein MZW92_34840 [Comamonadaceae bacterium]|nr:hypothetical protein [Comamonadaceae bacterium]
MHRRGVEAVDAVAVAAAAGPQRPMREPLAGRRVVDQQVDRPDVHGRRRRELLEAQRDRQRARRLRRHRHRRRVEPGGDWRRGRP